MKIFYDSNFNIDLGMLNRLARHFEFAGMKFKQTRDMLGDLPAETFDSPQQAMTLDMLEANMQIPGRNLSRAKWHVLRSLGLPDIPLVPFSWLDQHFLLPMRWACAATLQAARTALQGESCWNMSGGYTHAHAHGSGGFCIYNDISTTVRELRQAGDISDQTRILILDLDAYHGNGNAYDFEKDHAITILDLYNDGVYPFDKFSKKRVDIRLPLPSGSEGPAYLQLLEQGLQQLQARIDADGSFALAFVIAGTNVLASDPYARLALQVEDCIARDCRMRAALAQWNIPCVFLGGGGYGPDSARAQAGSLRQLYAS